MRLHHLDFARERNTVKIPLINGQRPTSERQMLARSRYSWSTYRALCTPRFFVLTGSVTNINIARLWSGILEAYPAHRIFPGPPSGCWINHKLQQSRSSSFFATHRPLAHHRKWVLSTRRLMSSIALSMFLVHRGQPVFSSVLYCHTFGEGVNLFDRNLS